MVYFFIVFISFLNGVNLTPEDFLQELCDNSSGESSVNFWLENMSPLMEDEKPTPEEVTEMIRHKSSLTIVPGRIRLLEENQVEGYYRIEFPDSEWSWIDENGKVRNSKGSTMIDYLEGKFYLVTTPLSAERMIDTSQSVTVALLLTGFMIFAGVILIFLARKSLVSR